MSVVLCCGVGADNDDDHDDDQDDDDDDDDNYNYYAYCYKHVTWCKVWRYKFAIFHIFGSHIHTGIYKKLCFIFLCF